MLRRASFCESGLGLAESIIEIGIRGDSCRGGLRFKKGTRNKECRKCREDFLIVRAHWGGRIPSF